MRINLKKLEDAASSCKAAASALKAPTSDLAELEIFLAEMRIIMRGMKDGSDMRLRWNVLLESCDV